MHITVQDILRWLITAITLIAIIGTISIVSDEWNLGNICPKIASIPACYLVLSIFLIAFISHLITSNYSSLIFFSGISLLAILATYGSLGEIFGFASCPRTSGGIPMCFISLGICISLLTLKYLEAKK